MVGVWDTVGSLGVPFGNIPGISSRTLQFHNTNLSKIVQHSYQALALDEQRKPYWAMLWTNFVPKQANEADAPQVDNRYVEQRWFAGAHCNVGGGYQNDLLPQRPLAWLQEKARGCGLGFRSKIVVTDDDLKHAQARLLRRIPGRRLENSYPGQTIRSLGHVRPSGKASPLEGQSED